MSNEALAFSHLKSNLPLDDEELEFLEKYLKNLKEFTWYDAIIINKISNYQYFKSKYNYSGENKNIDIDSYVEKLYYLFLSNETQVTEENLSLLNACSLILLDKIINSNLNNNISNDNSTTTCLKETKNVKPIDNCANKINSNINTLKLSAKIPHAFYKLGKNIDLNDQELNVIDLYISLLKKITYYDIEIINLISDNKYFTNKYSYSGYEYLFSDHDFFSMQLSKQNIVISKHEITILNKKSIVLLSKIFKLDISYNVFNEKNGVDIERLVYICQYSTNNSWDIIGDIENYRLGKVTLSFCLELANNIAIVLYCKINISDFDKPLQNNMFSNIFLLNTDNHYSIPFDISELQKKFLIENAIRISKESIKYSYLHHDIKRITSNNMSYVFGLFSSKVIKWRKENSKYYSDFGEELFEYSYEVKKLILTIKNRLRLCYYDKNEVIKDYIDNYNQRNIISDNNQDIIVVYTSKKLRNQLTSCKTNNHNRLNKRIKISNLKDNSSDFIDSLYCTICHKYFIPYDKWQKNIKGTFPYKVIMDDKISSRKTITDTTQNRSSINSLKKDNQSSNDLQTIAVTDFLVRSSLNKCIHKEHILTRVRATVSILKKEGMCEETFDASYCKNCNKFFIFESTYQKLKAMGHICCKVIEYQDLVENFSTFNSWQKKSILSFYGYNVNQNEALSTVKRQRILAFIIENNIMNPWEIISHLEMLIRTRKNMRNMKLACNKWSEDIDYIQRYQKVDASVRVRSIYAKVR